MIYLPSGYGGTDYGTPLEQMGPETTSCANYRDELYVVASTLPLGAASPMESETASSEWVVNMYGKKLTLCNGASRLCQTARSPRDATIMYAASSTTDAYLQGGDFSPRQPAAFGCAGLRTKRKGLTKD